MTDWFLGIDLAIDTGNHKECAIEDDGVNLCVHPPTAQSWAGVAIDGPFGFPAEVKSMLDGVVPSTEGTTDHFQSRATERTLRVAFKNLPIGKLKFALQAGGKRKATTARLFAESHVLPAVGLRTTPWTIYGVLGRASSTRLAPVFLKRSRRGLTKVVETHPRLLLLSLVDRVLTSRRRLSAPTLAALGQYKEGGKRKQSSAGARNRLRCLALLSRTTAVWTRGTRNALTISPPNVARLCGNNDEFDAFLCAIAAWGHLHDQTWRWDRVPGMSWARANSEGHIHVFQPVRTATP